MRPNSNSLVGIFLTLVLIVAPISAWVTNLVWAFTAGLSEFTAQTAVALVGIPMFPLGIVHGIYIWF